LGAVVLAGLIAPVLATALRPVWKLETISSGTFHLVASITETLGYTLTINDPVKKWIGTEEFLIAVAPQCSGVEGIALVTLFVTIFLALFRSELRFPRAFLLYPAGIAVSMILNVVRITVLLIIGLEGNAELAIGGFHSHAGWMMFTLIALGVVLVARSMPFLQKEPASVGGTLSSHKAVLPPLSQDDNAARIVPFAVFMISAIFAQAFSQSPGVVYPLRVVAMAAGLFFFLPVLARIAWRPTFTAITAGVAIGVMWIAVPYSVEDTTPTHGGLAGALLIGWLIARGIGTMLFVPIIEELFFRDYLERKVSGKAAPILRALLGQPEPNSRAARLGPQIFAALVTASLFAILHDRWVEAFIAGLVFSWVMAQRKNVADAVAAHMAANAIVFAYALATMQMHII
jgi:exosortase E/protease (VPEID-CTERM system)